VFVAIVSRFTTALGDAALVGVGEPIWVQAAALCRGLGAIVVIAVAAVSIAIAVVAASGACLALVGVIKAAAILIGNKASVHVVQCRGQFKRQLLVTFAGVDGTVGGVELAIDAVGHWVESDLVRGRVRVACGILGVDRGA